MAEALFASHPAGIALKGVVRFLSVAAAAAVALTVLAWVLDGTLFSSQFMTAQLDNPQVYRQLAADLPQSLVPQVNTREAADTRTVLESVLTPDYLKNLADSQVPKLEDYWRGNSGAPQLDLKQLQRSAVDQGLPVTPSLAQLTDNTIPLSAPGNPGQSLFAITTKLRWLAPLLAVIFGLLAWTFDRGRRGLRPAKILLLAAILTLIWYLLAGVVPGLLVPQFKSSVTLRPLVPVIQSLAKGLSGELSKRFLLAAEVLAAAGAVWGLLSLVLGLSRPKAKPSDEPAFDLRAIRRRH